MKFAKNVWLTAALSLGYAIPVMADCIYPTKPADPPNGATATQPEMVAAAKATRQYDADTKTYLACLDTETDGLVSKLGADPKPEVVQLLKQKQNLKYDAAVDELKKYVDEFNVQLRAFKAPKDPK